MNQELQHKVGSIGTSVNKLTCVPPKDARLPSSHILCDQSAALVLARSVGGGRR
jgi:hypothetical protein